MLSSHQNWLKRLISGMCLIFIVWQGLRHCFVSWCLKHQHVMVMHPNFENAADCRQVGGLYTGRTKIWKVLQTPMKKLMSTVERTSCGSLLSCLFLLVSHIAEKSFQNQPLQDAPSEPLTKPSLGIRSRRFTATRCRYILRLVPKAVPEKFNEKYGYSLYQWGEWSTQHIQLLEKLLKSEEAFLKFRWRWFQVNEKKFAPRDDSHWLPKLLALLWGHREVWPCSERHEDGDQAVQKYGCENNDFWTHGLDPPRS